LIFVNFLLTLLFPLRGSFIAVYSYFRGLCAFVQCDFAIDKNAT